MTVKTSHSLNRKQHHIVCNNDIFSATIHIYVQQTETKQMTMKTEYSFHLCIYILFIWI